MSLRCREDSCKCPPQARRDRRAPKRNFWTSLPRKSSQNRSTSWLESLRWPGRPSLGPRGRELRRGRWRVPGWELPPLGRLERKAGMKGKKKGGLKTYMLWVLNTSWCSIPTTNVFAWTSHLNTRSMLYRLPRNTEVRKRRRLIGPTRFSPLEPIWNKNDVKRENDRQNINTFVPSECSRLSTLWPHLHTPCNRATQRQQTTPLLSPLHSSGRRTFPRTPSVSSFRSSAALP